MGALARDQKSEEAQRRELGMAKASSSSTSRILKGRSLEIQAYDELCFPGLAAEWAEWGDRRPFVGALTLEMPTESDNEVLSWIAPERRRSTSASAACRWNSPPQQSPSSARRVRSWANVH
ncbi:putative glycosyltransferase B [Mycobacterium ulcerans str. Harvey]|uniref:Glycosyltransferase B n=1 Tax=Mycobacterium ulcerans str. Harvey TaxID=1299332 RepID=A0ABN0RAK8_MYCUL|nr:putative glycosyltransferase B [Mycobacterium ulcerans str. Harvey]